MSLNKGSAEIFEIEDGRARLRAVEIDPRNFLGVGPYLEALREQQGLSLATISDRTHIKASFLQAIEQMTLDALPTKSFAIGFVRSYAEVLGIDSVPIVERFKDEAGFSRIVARKDKEPHIKPAAPSARVAEPRAAEPMRLSLIAVLAILGFMVWCAFLVTNPSADAVREPLKYDGVPLAAESVEPRVVTDAAPAPQSPADFEPREIRTLPVVVEAAAIDRIEPVYPPACEAAAGPLETVDVAFTITPDGAVVSERIAASSNACFERAALNAIKRWRFNPRTIDGAPRPAFEQQANFRFDRPS